MSRITLENSNTPLAWPWEGDFMLMIYKTANNEESDDEQTIRF